MIYWILTAFLGFLVFAEAPLHHTAKKADQVTVSDNRLQAIQTVRYMNVLNDWRYDHPGQPDGVIPDATLGWSPVPGLNNLIAGGRTWVWQPDSPGLMAALLQQTRQSALTGRVSNRRLNDAQGVDMQVSVPSTVPDGSLVWLN
ncbi:type IV pilus biogenesis protein PilM [Klebsiella michiganensis]|uniref:type IV pilus biogenesis protein PilM n=1 Tax=Klebsiella michiganensis TaxID=1134687 RepID=UPI003F50AEAF